MDWKKTFKMLFATLAIIVNVAILLRISNVGASSNRTLSASASPAPCVTGTPQDSNPHYYCGAVMTGTIRVHPIYWFPGITGNSNYINLINRYYTDVATTPGGQYFFSILSHYADKFGNTPTNEAFDPLHDSWTDTVDSYPEMQLTSDDIYNEIQRAVAANNWQPSSGYSVYYPIYTTKSECFYASDDCHYGFHTAVAKGSSAEFIIGFIADGQDLDLPGGSPNNDADADRTISQSAHEEFEAITDPDGVGTGWSPEIGDKCQNGVYQWGTVDTLGANHYWNPDYYIIQIMWDINVEGCVQTTP